MAHWGLKNAKAYFVAERENRIFRIESDQGTYALRQHRQGLRSPSQIQAELRWMADLHQAGLPVPRPLAPYVYDYPYNQQSQLFSLITWLPGQALWQYPGKDDPKIFNALGQLIRKMHDQPDPHLDRPLLDRPHLDRPVWTAPELLGEAPLWGRFWEHEALSPKETTLLLKFRQEAWAALQAADLPVRLIHADMLKENVLIHQGRVSLIDFDDCAYSYPLFDLTAPLVQPLADENFYEKRDALLAGYGAIDRRALAVLFAIRCCTYLGWVRDKQNTPAGQAMSDRIRVRALSQVHQWMDGNSPIDAPLKTPLSNLIA